MVIEGGFYDNGVAMKTTEGAEEKGDFLNLPGGPVS